MMRVGVEVGGTFTDLVLVDGAGVRVEKVPSTPHQPDLGAMQALAAAEVDFGRLEDLVHGSTVATNAVLERKGAKVCLVVSRGTRDVLFLQRHTRRHIYDLFYRKPQPVLRRRDVVEVAERLTADGSVVEALDEAEAEALLREKLAGGYAAVAICLLNSYVNPRHEERLAALVRQIDPSLSVTCSAHVCREFREYERCSTAALAAYVQPVVASYLGVFRPPSRPPATRAASASCNRTAAACRPRPSVRTPSRVSIPGPPPASSGPPARPPSRTSRKS